MMIRGYFGEVSQANNAIEKLNKEGYNNVFLDANDYHNTNLDRQTDNIASVTSLSNLSLDPLTSGNSEGTSPLGAANPMVSGMGEFNEIRDINYTVNVEIDNRDLEEVKKIIEDTGGSLDDPYIDDMEVIEDADIDYGEINS